MSLVGGHMSQGLVSCLDTHTTPLTGGLSLNLCAMYTTGGLRSLSGFKSLPMSSVVVHQRPHPSPCIPSFTM